jgi:hypothetical protein
VRAFVPFHTGPFLAALACLMIVASTAVPAAGDDVDPRERIIVMNSGRILSGIAMRNAGGWLMEQPGGRVQIPIEQVRVVADSMVDAYRRQRDSVVEPTPATHMALAQWCISYRLHDEARDELRQCLKVDPDHSAARRLLRRLEDIMDRADAKPASVGRAPRRSADGFLVPDAESLGGLSNDAAVTFTQRIQPLLMNKCGNASCHGTTSGTDQQEGFRLIAVRTGLNAHRLYTERNLAEVLRYVDLQKPSLSPLVALPQGTHGGIAGVFHGTTGNSQLKMLRAWINTVAVEKQAEEEELSPARPSIVAKPPGPSTDSRIADSRITDSRITDSRITDSRITDSRITDSRITDARIADSRITDALISGATNSGAINTGANDTDTDPLDVTADSSVAGIRPVAGKRGNGGVPENLPAAHPLELTSAQRLARPTDARQAAADHDRPANDPFDPEVFNRRFHPAPRR